MNSSVVGLTVLPNGGVVAIGGFSQAGGVNAKKVARWNGSAWSALGVGVNMASASAVAAMPNGDIVVGGGVLGGGMLQRWNGIAWSHAAWGLDRGVLSLFVTPTGELVVGGDFTLANGAVAPYFARFVPTCPATATPTGLGCSGSGGVATYAALNLPWTGSTFRARGTNLPTLAFVAAVTGFATTSIPLVAVLPPSPAPCALLVTPDLVDVTIPVGGTLDTQIVIPNSLSLAGLSLHQQLVALEVSAQLQFVENTSSNALSLTVGAL